MAEWTKKKKPTRISNPDEKDESAGREVERFWFRGYSGPLCSANGHYARRYIKAGLTAKCAVSSVGSSGSCGIPTHTCYCYTESLNAEIFIEREMPVELALAEPDARALQECSSFRGCHDDGDGIGIAGNRRVRFNSVRAHGIRLFYLFIYLFNIIII